MPIQVVCPGCQTRFKVSDKFAGQKGGCPKCKAIIQVPKPDQEKIVIHEPDYLEAGPRDSKGVAVLKPLERVDTRVEPLVVIALGGFAFVSLVAALLIRLSGKPPDDWILYVGAVVLAPPICWAGYSFLREDEELEAYSGLSLWIRTGFCALGYALLWGVFGYLEWRLFGETPLEIWQVALLGPAFLFVGAGIAYCCYDFDLGTGFFHYALYLVVTIVLRLVMGLPPLGAEFA